MQLQGYRSQKLFQLIQNAFKANKLAHAYLVEGSIRGEGKIFAEQLLAMIFCESKHDEKPCNNCPGCRLAIRHDHRDMVWIEPQRKSRMILTEHILLVREHIFQTASGWKAAVLLGADRMNIESSNMLLKTLEEPPPKSVFLLVTEQSEALLPTIVSRCQKLVLSEKSTALSADMRNALIPILKSIVLAKGDVLQGMLISKNFMQLLKEVRKNVEEEELQEEEKFPDDDLEIRAELEKLLQARIEARYREERAKLLNGVIEWFRDFMLYSSGVAEEKVFCFSEELPFIKEHAKDITFASAKKKLEAIDDARYQLEQYLQEGNVFEKLFVKLVRA